MKKIINISFFILFLACLFLLFYKKKDDEITLNVYNSGDFISTLSNGGLDVNELFTKKTGIKVNYTTFQSNEEMLAKILGGGASYDVIFPSDYVVEKLIKKNMLAELNFENIPNYNLVNKILKNLDFDPENKFAVPYLFGVVGIFANINFVEENNNNNIDWDILWNKKYAKKIIMFDNPRDDLAIALLKNKKSINSTNKDDWILAAEELKDQRALVQSYMSDQIFDKLLGEEAYLAPFYYGYTAQSESLRNNKDIKFVIPETTNKFVDCACILKDSKHKAAGEKYINFLLTEEVSRANAEVTGYLPANKNVSEQLISESEALKNYDMKKAYVYSDLSPEISKLNDESWVNIRAGEENLDFYNIILTLIFCLLIILNIIIFFKKFKNTERELGI